MANIKSSREAAFFCKIVLEMKKNEDFLHFFFSLPSFESLM